MQATLLKTNADEAMAKANTQVELLRTKADGIISSAREEAIATRIKAESDAKEIVNSVGIAKQNAEQYEATVKAMKNIIQGYGDEYYISNESVLDELEAEYNHEEAGQELTKIRKKLKTMISNNKAADCKYVEAHRKTTAMQFIVDAFNGKVETIMAKAKHNNYGILLQQLEDAFTIINHNGKAFRDVKITNSYYKIIIEQLKLVVAVQELKRIDREEQKRIKQELREEAKVIKEVEAALKTAEREEKLLQEAVKKTEARLASVAKEEKAKYEQQLASLREKLTEAKMKGQRAISRAQQTKQGYVYVISNIGSFGENVFKIGLTRRLEPMDRVKELGSASVPFRFDVHAMIYSEDAPKLEKDLHHVFELEKVNKVNSRREFFRVTLSSIREQVTSLNLGVAINWTMKAKAAEYRESLQIAREAEYRDTPQIKMVA